MEKPHIPLLKAFEDLKFNLGKKTLMEYLKGDLNPTIERNNLDELDSYGSLYMLEKGELFNLIEDLIKNDFLELTTINGGFQVVKRTSKGVKEIFARNYTPQLNKNIIKHTSLGIDYEISKINEEDKKLFSAFDFFLNKFNDNQKKAIISGEKNILCVAGAGSGKTTVLTKRIQFLTKFKSISQEKILAITFTRKARDEMKLRLEKLEITNVKVETFNSFCEKLLKTHGHLIYNDDVKVASFGDKISLIQNSIKKIGTNFEIFYEDYFTKKQVREKSKDELFFIFVNDIFSIIDYYKNTESEIEQFYERETHSQKKRIAKLIYEISKTAQQGLKNRNLRDFSDQIIDSLRLLRENPNLIPNYEHMLVDEFQDVNLVQFELIKLINPKNLFVVGDPRQAIYGWRGSDIKYIIDFPKIFEKTQILELTTNYRSNSQIVEFSNNCVESMNLSDMIPHNKTEENTIYLIEQDNEQLEKTFVSEAIKNSKNKRCEIFILARTNRILENYADFFSKMGIKYTIKSEEEYKNGEPKEDEVVLATIHSIKGMEANEVYIVNSNTLSFPNKVADNFVFSLIKQEEDYDKNSEELRLFYVALTRARSKLIITYTGNHTKFITSKMLSQLVIKEKNKNLFDFGSEKKFESKGNSSNSTILKNLIKDWRNEISNRTGLPTYMIISNKAIEDLIVQRPQSKVELLNVNGLGDAKIAKYGEELLKIING